MLYVELVSVGTFEFPTKTIAINLVLLTLLFASFLLNSHILIVVEIENPPTVMIVVVADVNSVGVKRQCYNYTVKVYLSF